MSLSLLKSRITIKILERFPESLFIVLGKRNFKKILKSIKKVSAYKKLLKEKNININKIKNIKDINILPIIDKEMYINKYRLSEILNHPIPEHYTIEESSGYSGQPLFWLRSSGQDDGFLSYMQMGFTKIFGIDKKSTLLINTFALGTWVTGIKFARFACMLANKKDINMTVVNIGTDKEAALKYLRSFSQYYDQVILAGYPPMLTSIVEEVAKEKSIKPLSKINILAGGEGFTEEWRDYIALLLRFKIENFETKIVSALGAADTGLEIGYEQPITILFRRFLKENIHLWKELYGEDIDYVPNFFQFNPMKIWVEEVDKELVFSSSGAVPIVRYNLHDLGGVITFSKMIQMLQTKYNVNELQKTLKPIKLPLCYVIGRSDGTISVDGANIYVNDVKSVLDDVWKIKKYMLADIKSNVDWDELIPHKKIREEILKYKLDKNVSKMLRLPEFARPFESFKLGTSSQRIDIYLELRKDVKLDTSLKTEYLMLLNKALTVVLAMHSSNYKSLLLEQLDSARLNISIYEYGQHEIFKNSHNKIKLKYLINGKHK